MNTVSLSAKTPALSDQPRLPKRHRRRSKPRQIRCPHHGVVMTSVSQKYPLYAESAPQLQQNGVPRKAALALIANRNPVPLLGEWIEAFWCPHCQRREWFQVHKTEAGYQVKIAPQELWQRSTGTIHPEGNLSVGEFTRKQARRKGGRRYYE